MRAYPRPFALGACLLMLIAAPLLTGCAAGQLTNMWRDESFQAPPMHNVLVVALRKDPVRRRIWEDSFVHGLAARGAKATASYRLFADAPPDTEQVADAVRRDGYDGVLVSERLPDDTQETFVPGYTRREAVTRQSRFNGAYYTGWETVRVPSRTELVRVANFKTDVWTTTEGGRLVWSGTSATTDKLDESLVNTKVEKLILPELAKAGIVAGKPAR